MRWLPTTAGSKPFGQEVLASATVDGALWGVPLDVNRNNVVAYSPAVLARAELEPPRSLDELKAACVALAASGKNCISLSNEGSTHTAWILDGILPAVAGAEASRRFLRGELAADDEGFRQALEIAAELLEFVNADHDEIDHVEAALRVVRGEAAFRPTGDWVQGTLLEAGYELDEHIALTAHPGSSDAFVFDVVHTGAGVAATDNLSALEAWLEVAGSEAGQRAFSLHNTVPTAIPARSIEDVADFDRYRQQAIADFSSPSIARVPATDLLLDNELLWEVQGVLGEFISSRDVAATVAWFEDNYSRFAER